MQPGDDRDFREIFGRLHDLESARAGNGLPNPSGEPDGSWIRTASGVAVWVPSVTASEIDFVPVGTISATDVQAAIAEVAAEASGAVSSVFGRTGAVVAVAGDYYGAVPAALTGATQASRFAGATVSGAPVSGTFVAGDHILSLADGKWYVCTVGGTPGTWVTPASGAGVTYGTPAVVLGTAAANGSIDEAIRRDSTIVAFDATSPSTQAIGDSAVVGTAAVAARRDHKHAMPAFATPAIVLGSAAAAGSAATLIRSDGTIAAFDTTAPTTQAFGDAAAIGTAAFAARRDHKHAMPATPVTGFSKNGSAVLTGAVTLSAGAGISLTQSSQDIAIAASGSVGSELDYVERTTDLALTATSDATAVAFITGNAVAYDGSTRVKIEIWVVAADISAAQAAVLNLYDGSTDLGRVALANNPLASGSANNPSPLYGVRYLTPSNATHTYSIRGWKTGGTCSLIARAGGTATYMPAWMRITRA